MGTTTAPVKTSTPAPAKTAPKTAAPKGGSVSPGPKANPVKPAKTETPAKPAGDRFEAGPEAKTKTKEEKEAADKVSAITRGLGEDPAVEKADTEKPGAEKAETDKPATDKPADADKPATDKAETDKPATDKPADADKPADPKFDPNNPSSSLFNGLDENGESAAIKLHADAAAKVGVVKGGAEVDASVTAARTDTGSTVVGLNADVAAKLGIDLGFFEIGVKGGVGYSAKARFPSADAAERFTKGKLSEALGTEGDNTPGNPADAPTIIKESRKMLGVETSAGVEVGDSGVKFSGDLKRTVTDQTFTTPDGVEHHGSEDATEFSIKQDMKFPGGIGYEVGYTQKDYTQVGDPVQENNGKYRHQKFEMKFSRSQLESMPLDKLNGQVGDMLKTYGVSLDDAALSKLTEKIKATGVSGTKDIVSLGLEFQSVKDGDKYQNQYTRLFMGGETSFEGSLKTPVAEAQLKAGVGAQERVFEKIGDRTQTYASQNFLRDPAGWDKFKTDNRDELTHLIQNTGSPEAKKALAEGGFDAGIAAMEKQWTGDAAQREATEKQLKTDLDQISDFSKHWNVDYFEERSIIDSLSKYKDNPERLSQMFHALEARGIDRGELSSWIDEFGLNKRLNSMYDSAAAWDKAS